MTLTKEESEKIKEHLLKQLSNFPKEKQFLIKKSIESLNETELESFIQKNELTHLGDQCIFCSIIAGNKNSVRIAENKENIAILDINPLSKGHILILPKEHQEKNNPSSKELILELTKKIQKKFNPREIKINESIINNHALIELIPIYGTEKARTPKTIEELQEIKEELNKIEELQKPQEQEPKLPILPPRIP